MSNRDPYSDSAFARCFSCRFSSFWRFWKVIDMDLLGKLVPFYLQ